MGRDVGSAHSTATIPGVSHTETHRCVDDAPQPAPTRCAPIRAAHHVAIPGPRAPRTETCAPSIRACTLTRRNVGSAHSTALILGVLHTETHRCVDSVPECAPTTTAHKSSAVGAVHGAPGAPLTNTCAPRTRA
eukprot:TRINITY_DN1250_c0_g1_i1.p3 TRINITY_DN1250_c0_g1~~TRINITY_DN1250_c0_g1_i1.p3  ORF type:complete len:134 (-),score=3.45 TRINITY_DN1250_c0_g1_i1:272-673(-)